MWVPIPAATGFRPIFVQTPTISGTGVAPWNGLRRDATETACGGTPQPLIWGLVTVFMNRAG